MLGQLGQQVAKVLGDRFSLTNLLPVTVLAGLVWLLVISGAYTANSVDLTMVADRLGKEPGQAVLVTFGVILSGVLLRPFQVALVQFLEGYWSSRALRLFHELATELHRRRRENAQIMAIVASSEPAGKSFKAVVDHAHRQWRIQRIRGRAEDILSRYPTSADRVMPTRLGNVLRTGEDAAGKRYGLDLNAIAMRLWPSLSPKIAASISRSLDLIDTMSALCVVWCVATVVALPVVWHPSGWSWIPLGTAVMTFVAYRAALRAATGHATLLATAVDLHRFDMLSALHYRLPDSVAQEQQFNSALSRFFASADGPPAITVLGDIRYQHPTPSGTTQTDSTT